MATTKVIDIVRRAVAILNDAGAVRWKRVEIQDGINTAYEKIVTLRPEANALKATVTLAAGTRQQMTDTGAINLPDTIQVLDITRNMAATSKKKAIQRTERDLMDRLLPDWHTAKASVNIENWMPDPLLPKEFMVYPPATALAQVEVVYSEIPAYHALLEAELDPDGADTTTINLDDIYADEILDWTLYRLFEKDSESGSMTMASAHLQAFSVSMGLKNKTRHPSRTDLQGEQ